MLGRVGPLLVGLHDQALHGDAGRQPQRGAQVDDVTVRVRAAGAPAVPHPNGNPGGVHDSRLVAASVLTTVVLKAWSSVSSRKVRPVSTMVVLPSISPSSRV